MRERKRETGSFFPCVAGGGDNSPCQSYVFHYKLISAKFMRGGDAWTLTADFAWCTSRRAGGGRGPARWVTKRWKGRVKEVLAPHHWVTKRWERASIPCQPQGARHYCLSSVRNQIDDPDTIIEVQEVQWRETCSDTFSRKRAHLWRPQPLEHHALKLSAV